jgi:hypothetical protein
MKALVLLAGIVALTGMTFEEAGNEIKVTATGLT